MTSGTWRFAAGVHGLDFAEVSDENLGRVFLTPRYRVWTPFSSRKSEMWLFIHSSRCMSDIMFLSFTHPPFAHSYKKLLEGSVDLSTF